MSRLHISVERTVAGVEHLRPDDHANGYKIVYAPRFRGSRPVTRVRTMRGLVGVRDVMYQTDLARRLADR